MRPLLLAGALLLVTLPSQARITTRVVCGPMVGHYACVTDNEVIDRILIIGPDGGERITVECGAEWAANGPNSQEFVQSVVNSYCNLS